MALFLSPFNGIYINIAWYIFAIMFSAVKLSSEISPNVSSVPQCFCKMYCYYFFGNWIIFLHQSLSGSQEFQQMEWFVYTTWKFPGWGRKAKLKQKSVSLMRKGSVFVLCMIIGARCYLYWFFSFTTAGTGLIFIFGLLFRTNASDVRLLYRKRDLIGALCRWLHGLFSKGNRDLLDLPLRRARAELSQAAAHGTPSTSRPTGSRADEEKLFCTHVLIVKWIFQVWRILDLLVS